MDKQYIIFDFDNTLVNSLGYWAKTEFKQLFKIYGKKPDKTFKKLKSGTSNAQAAQIFIDLAKVDITVEEVFEKIAFSKYKRHRTYFFVCSCNYSCYHNEDETKRFMACL